MDDKWFRQMLQELTENAWRVGAEPMDVICANPMVPDAYMREFLVGTRAIVIADLRNFLRDVALRFAPDPQPSLDLAEQLGKTKNFMPVIGMTWEENCEAPSQSRKRIEYGKPRYHPLPDPTATRTFTLSENCDFGVISGPWGNKAQE